MKPTKAAVSRTRCE